MGATKRQLDAEFDAYPSAGVRPAPAVPAARDSLDAEFDAIPSPGTKLPMFSAHQRQTPAEMVTTPQWTTDPLSGVSFPQSPEQALDVAAAIPQMAPWRLGVVLGPAAEMGRQALRSGVGLPNENGPARVAAAAAGPLLGEALAALPRPVLGKPLMGAALRTNDRAAIEAALNEGIAPGRSATGRGSGLAQVRAAEGALSGERNALLARAQAAGTEMPTQTLFDPLERIVQRLESDAVRAPALREEAKTLRQTLEEFKAANPGGKISVEEAQRLKEIYADMASPGYAKQQAGQSIPLGKRELQLNKKTADVLRKWLSDNTGVGPLNQRIEGLKRLAPRMARAEATAPPPVMSRGPLGVLDLANPMAHARAMPGASGRLAVAASSPLTEAILRYLPRAVALGLLSGGSAVPDTTGR